MTSGSPGPGPARASAGETVRQRIGLGTRIAERYRIVQVIAHGASIDVYGAVDESNGRPIALEVVGDPDAESGLVAAFVAARHLRHSHVARALDVLRLEGGRAALVTDWVRGEPLVSSLPLPYEQALPVALGIVRAVAALHAAGLVHGCLCPEAFVVESRGGLPIARLVDIRSVAAPAPVTGREPSAAPGPLRGLAGYVAPEVLLGQVPTAAADLYSIGCVLHEVLLGVPVFPDVTVDESRAAHLECVPSISRDFEPILRELLIRLLAKSPHKRPASADAVLATLARLTGRAVERELLAVARASLARRVIVGDTEALHTVEIALGAAIGGRTGRVFVISGRRGAGRTRMADDLRLWAARGGASSIFVSDDVHDFEAQRVATSLERLVRRTGRSPSTGGGPDPISAVGARLAELSRQRPTLVVIDRPSEDPSRLLETHTALAIAARLAPVVGVIFADAPTGFGASEDALAIEPFDAVRRRALAEAHVPLRSADSAAVADALELAAAASPADVMRAIGCWIEAGIIARGERGWTLDRRALLSDGVVGAARAIMWAQTRARRLGGDVRPALAALAVIEAPSDVVSIARVAGITPASARIALQHLHETGVVQRADDRRFEMTGAADVARAALAIMDLPFRVAAHRAAAELGPIDDDDAVRAGARRVWHRLEAGQSVRPAEIAEACETWCREGDSRRALAMIDRSTTPGDDHADTAHIAPVLCIARARALLAGGAHRAARRALEAGLAADDGRVRVALAEHLVDEGLFRAAVGRLDGRALHAEARLVLARAYLGLGRPTDAEDVVQPVVDDPHAPSIHHANAAWILARIALERDEPAEAEALAMRGLERVERHDVRVRARLLDALGRARHDDGRAEAARHALEQAVTALREGGLEVERADALDRLARSYAADGHWTAAERTWRSARLVTARVGSSLALVQMTMALARAALIVGRPSASAIHFDSAAAMSEAMGDRRLAAAACVGGGDALTRAGDFAAAESAYDAAESTLSALDGALDPGDRVALARRRADLLLARGEPFAARSVAEDVADEPALRDRPDEAAHLARVRAACLRESGAAAAADAMVRDAIRAFDHQGAVLEAARARLELVRVLVESARHGEAHVELERAFAVFERFGARLELEEATEIRDELRRAEPPRSRDILRGKLLLDVALNFGSTLDLDTLLPLVLERIVALLEAERGLVALCDADGRVQTAVVDNLEWDGPGHPLPISQGLLDQVVRGGEPVTVQHAADDVEYGRHESVMLHGLRAIAGVPIRDAERVIGVIYVDSRVDLAHDFDAELELLTALSRLVGTAVANARLYEEQRFRAQLLATMVHDFRSPLMVVQVNGNLLATHMYDGEEDIGAMATDVEACAHRMLRMVDDTLELARMDAGGGQPKPQRVDLREALDRQLEPLRGVARPLEIELRLDAPAALPSVHTVPARLAVVFDNLVFNALKHASSGTLVTVTLCLRADCGPASVRDRPIDATGVLFERVAPLVPRPDTQFVQIGVHNHGDPIPKSAWPDLFRAWSTGRSAGRRVSSTGLGLSIVDQTVRHLGGCVWLDSDAVQGTTFHFTVPTDVLTDGPTGVDTGSNTGLDTNERRD